MAAVGARGRPGQYFSGQLANLVLMINTTDSDDAIDCLNKCQENLELSGLDFMDNGIVSDRRRMLAEIADVGPRDNFNFLFSCLF